MVFEALTKAGRQDLIGFEKHCLIKPRKFSGEKNWSKPGRKGSFGGGKPQNTEKKGKKKTIRNVHNKKKK